MNRETVANTSVLARSPMRIVAATVRVTFRPFPNAASDEIVGSVLSWAT